MPPLPAPLSYPAIRCLQNRDVSLCGKSPATPLSGRRLRLTTGTTNVDRPAEPFVGYRMSKRSALQNSGVCSGIITSKQFDLNEAWAVLLWFRYTRATTSRGNRSILQTRSRRRLSISPPCASFFTSDSETAKWVPRLSYTYDRCISGAFVHEWRFHSARTFGPASLIKASRRMAILSRLRLGYPIHHSFRTITADPRTYDLC